MQVYVGTETVDGVTLNSVIRLLLGQVTLQIFRGPSPFYESVVQVYTESQKRTDFETVQLQIIRIDFDEIWQKYSKDSIE